MAVSLDGESRPDPEFLGFFEEGMRVQVDRRSALRSIFFSLLPQDHLGVLLRRRRDGLCDVLCEGREDVESVSAMRVRGKYTWPWKGHLVRWAWGNLPDRCPGTCLFLGGCVTEVVLFFLDAPGQAALFNALIACRNAVLKCVGEFLLLGFIYRLSRVLCGMTSTSLGSLVQARRFTLWSTCTGALFALAGMAFWGLRS